MHVRVRVRVRALQRYVKAAAPLCIGLAQKNIASILLSPEGFVGEHHAIAPPDALSLLDEEILGFLIVAGAECVNEFEGNRSKRAECVADQQLRVTLFRSAADIRSDVRAARPAMCGRRSKALRRT